MTVLLAVERTQLGVACGYVDAYLCVFGGLRYVDFRGKRPDHGPGEGPLATVEALELGPEPLPFAVAFTGVRHRSDSVHRPLRERWLAGLVAAGVVESGDGHEHARMRVPQAGARQRAMDRQVRVGDLVAVLVIRGAQTLLRGGTGTWHGMPSLRGKVGISLSG